MDIEGVQIYSSRPVSDNRGFFRKTFVAKELQNQIEFNPKEVFSSYTEAGFARGMHLQTGLSASTRIVTLVAGRILDALLDLRPSSPTYLNILEIELGEGNSISGVLVPPGVAHGFLALSDSYINYVSSEYNVKELDTGVNIQSLNLSWKDRTFQISIRDQSLPDIQSWMNVDPLS